VGPAVAIALELGVELLAVCTLLFAFAALKGYQFSFKPLLIQLGHIFNAIKLPGRFPFVGGSHLLGGLGDWFIDLANEIERILAGFYLTSEHAVTWLWEQLARQARWLGQELGALADTIDKKFGWLLAVFPPATALWLAVQAYRKLPGLVRAITHPDTTRLRSLISTAEADVAGLEHELDRLARGIDRTAKQLGGRISRTGAAFGTAVGGLAGSIGLTWTWIQKLRHLLTKHGAAAFVGAALATLGLGFLRCPRFSKAGKRACSIDDGLLETLLADTLLIVGTLSLVDFARAMQPEVAGIGKLVRWFWRIS
jgi:hypothetical protein